MRMNQNEEKKKKKQEKVRPGEEGDTEDGPEGSAHPNPFTEHTERFLQLLTFFPVQSLKLLFGQWPEVKMHTSAFV